MTNTNFAVYFVGQNDQLRPFEDCGVNGKLCRTFYWLEPKCVGGYWTCLLVGPKKSIRPSLITLFLPKYVHKGGIFSNDDTLSHL